MSRATDDSLRRLAYSVEGLIDAAALLKNDAPDESTLDTIIERGKFRPDEDEAIGYWFARFITIRESAWSVIDDVLSVLGGARASRDGELRFFLLGYAAVCVLVGIDRVMLFEVGRHSIIQRKLNEPFPQLRIPRKQFTRVFEGFVNEANALSILDAMKFANRKRRELEAFDNDPVVGTVARALPGIETALDPSKRKYLRGVLAFVSHKWRRRGVVSANNVLAGVAEGVGRVASEFYVADNKRVSADILSSIGNFLEPGDVIVTRHAIALTNLFMPGFWPHAAMYVGSPAQRDKLGVRVDDEKRERWTGDVRTLEALKDGVRLRPLSETLAVDSFVVLRPRLPVDSIARAIERGVVHEGKPYNFDFDFFSSDRLVCTEVVYRSYDGLEGVRFPLTERAGRKTLSAEDLLDFALGTGPFEPVAIFGVTGCETDVALGGDVRDIAKASYDAQPG
jgi:hypothetical protein